MTRSLTSPRGRARRIVLGLAGLALCAPAACKDPVDPNEIVRTRWLVTQEPTPAEIRPALVGSLVLFGTRDGTVVARDAETGAPSWTARVAYSGDAVSGAHMVVSRGIVVIPVANHVTGIDAVTGAERWRYTTPVDSLGLGGRRPGYVVASHPAADSSTAYIPAWGASVSAVDLQSGAVRWVWRGDSGMTTPMGSMGVALSGDTIIATAWHFTDSSGAGNSVDAWVLGLDKATGRQLWRVILSDPRWGGTIAHAPPLMHGNLAIVGLGSGDLYGIDRNTHTVIWRVISARYGNPMSVGVFASPALSGDTVYLDRGTGELGAFRASDGRLLWSAHHGDQIQRDLLVTDRYVYAPSFKYLHIFDRFAGKRVASLEQPKQRGGSIMGAAAGAKGHIYIGAYGQAWSFDEPR